MHVFFKCDILLYGPAGLQLSQCKQHGHKHTSFKGNGTVWPLTTVCIEVSVCLASHSSHNVSPVLTYICLLKRAVRVSLCLSFCVSVVEVWLRMPWRAAISIRLCNEERTESTNVELYPKSFLQTPRAASVGMTTQRSVYRDLISWPEIVLKTFMNYLAALKTNLRNRKLGTEWPQKVSWSSLWPINKAIFMVHLTFSLSFFVLQEILDMKAT